MTPEYHENLKNTEFEISKRHKEFKDTEIGRIPKEWEVVKLGEISLDFIGGGTPSTSNPEYWNGNIPWMTSAHINGRSITTGQRYITEKGLRESATRLVPKENILVATRVGIGKVAVNLIDIAISQDLTGIVLKKDRVLPDFVYWVLTNNESKLKSLAQGSTIKGIRREDLAKILIPLPPLPEQRKIAEILSTVDEAIQKVDEAIHRTERLKRGLMHRLLTRGIGHREFKDTEIGRIPKEWEVVRLGNKEITEELFYGITAKAVDKDTRIKMLRTTDIKNYSVDWKTLPFCEVTERRNDLNKYVLRKGDLIVARAGTVGVSVLVDRDFDNVVFGSYLIKVKLKPSVDPKFVHYFFQSPFYWKHLQKAQGSTLKNINLPLLESLKIPLPPLPEQRKIVQILSTIDGKIELERKRKEKLERIKRGLMNELLTGKVRVKI